MGKVLIILSIIILALMSVGAALQPQSSVFWLASVAATYQHVREALLAVLVIQLATRPPRHAWFRILSGCFAAITMAWAIRQTNLHDMQLFDTLAIAGASLAIIITALERRAINRDFYCASYMQKSKQLGAH